MIWRPDGSVRNLTRGSGLYDVQQPGISFDGKKIAFSAVTKFNGQWRLWEIGVDGTGLRQLTFDGRNIPIPEDPHAPGRNWKKFHRYGDFGPEYLPDGRIIFVSTRFMTLCEACAIRGQNLYVLDPETKNILRRTTERGGAIDPVVLKDGRVLFSHWMDGMNTPSITGGGLRPLRVEYTYNPSIWGLWAMHPDGSRAGRYAFVHGGLVDIGGVYQPSELPNGDIVTAYRNPSALLRDTLPSAVTIVRPGLVPFHDLKFLGNPYYNTGAHALCPSALPDGRILVSYTTATTVWKDANYVPYAKYDFGIYIADKTLSTLIPLYNHPRREDLDAVPVIVRSAPIIADGVDADVITDDPTVNLGKEALLVNSNVYADLPVDMTRLPSPRPGTVQAIDVYDDSQMFTTSDEYPRLEKQMPRLLGHYPVAADGSFQVKVPADRPLLFVLVNRDSVAVRSPMAMGPGEQLEDGVLHSFDGHDYLRPHNQARCTGCHRGHMMAGEFMKAKSNLARLAKASASSEPKPFLEGAHRINDLRLPDSQYSYSWLTREQGSPWVRLDWEAPVSIDKILLYPVKGERIQITESTLTLSDGTVRHIGPLPVKRGPVEVSFNAPHAVTWVVFKINGRESKLAGLAEMVVNGPAELAVFPDTPPAPPVNFKMQPHTTLLTWKRNQSNTDEPSVAGYRIYYGGSSGKYTKSVDVGNTTHHVMRFPADGTYYLVAKSYNVHGTESTAGSNEIMTKYEGPRVFSVEPNHGPVGGHTPITIKGENFSVDGVTVSLGRLTKLPDTRVVDSNTITAQTWSNRTGPVDVKVVNSDGTFYILQDAFIYEK
jgi:hypothetical protein